MVIIFDSIYLSRNIISLQIKAHEVHIKPIKERESILEYKESDDDEDEDEDEEDSKSEKQEESLDELLDE